MEKRIAAGSNIVGDRGRPQRSNAAFSKYHFVLLWAATVSAITCLFGLGGVVLFANPAENANVVAFYVFCLSGSFLGWWAAGCWVRRWVGHGLLKSSRHATRQASLISLGVIGALLLIQIGWFGIPAIISLGIALAGLELLFSWREMSQ